jgi:hypothetical protein
MNEVDLFFPDVKTLAAYAALLETGPAEINSQQLTLKACLDEEQIFNARLLYGAVPFSAQSWEGLENWLAHCKSMPARNRNSYWQGCPFPWKPMYSGKGSKT